MARLASGLLGACALLISTACGDDGLPTVTTDATTSTGGDTDVNPTTTPPMMTTDTPETTTTDPDTTADSDPTDGATTEADTTDGTTEGGTTEGGTTEGGTTDGGTTDGGTTDGGTTDTGTTDGGTTDTGTTDTGESSTGLLLDLPPGGDCVADPCVAGEEICSDASGVAVCMSLYATERNGAVIARLNPDDFTILSSSVIADVGGGDVGSGTTGLAADPTTGLLWTVVKDGGGARILGSIEPTTGLVTTVGVFAEQIAGIAFDEAGGLWALSGQAGTTSNAVFTVSLVDASLTLQVDVGNDPANTDGEALGFHPGDALLYRWSGNGDPKLFGSIDPVAMTETDIGASLLTAGEVTAATYIPGGAFEGSFLVTTRAQEVYRVETDGTFSDIGATAVGIGDYYKGLAYVPTPPLAP